MRIETVLKITREWEFAMARNAKESLCVLISSAVRNGDVERLAELTDSRDVAERAIAAYKRIHRSDEPSHLEAAS